jgi:3-phenylpropionate/trans-cinnamate dioxygenase ferredoxin component
MQEIRLCGRDDLKPGVSRRFEVAGCCIAVVRIEDDFYAIGDRCTHANFSLADGEIDPDKRELVCWKHGSNFSLETGQPRSLPATKPVPVYHTRVVGDDLMVVVP